jgi:23S rRNA G2445 N2-methylase RlmL
LDPKKIALAKKNEKVYEVAHRIDFRVRNSFLVAANLKVDAVVTSPPWGGPGYEKQAKFDARDLCGRETGGMAAIIRMARAVASKVVLHVPKNIDKVQVRVTRYHNIIIIIHKCITT